MVRNTKVVVAVASWEEELGTEEAWAAGPWAAGATVAGSAHWQGPGLKWKLREAQWLLQFWGLVCCQLVQQQQQLGQGLVRVSQNSSQKEQSHTNSECGAHGVSKPPVPFPACTPSSVRYSTGPWDHFPTLLTWALNPTFTEASAQPKG